jgi:hypothetical protein
LAASSLDQIRADRGFAARGGAFRLFHRGLHMAMVLI